MPQVKMKEDKRYLFYRAYCLVFAILWNAIGIWEFSHALTDQKPPHYMLYLIPFVIPALFMVFSWAVFPWDYSIFGRYERTPFPTEEPILAKRGSWGKISWFNASIPFFSWHVYRSGLGISIIGVGKVFIPVSNILEVGSGFFKGYRLRHNSPELRNPVTMPGKKIYEAVQDMMKKRGQ